MSTDSFLELWHVTIGAAHIAVVGAGVAGSATAMLPQRLAIPLLGLFQNETWQPEYAGIPIYGNGALH